MTTFHSITLLFSLSFSVQATPDSSRFETMAPEKFRIYDAQAASSGFFRVEVD